MSELLITHIWKPLHRFSMGRSGLEEADSNKLATFRKKKKVLSYSSKPKMLVALLRKNGTKKNTAHRLKMAAQKPSNPCVGAEILK